MNTNQTDTNQMQEQEIDLIELFYKLLAHCFFALFGST